MKSLFLTLALLTWLAAFASGAEKEELSPPKHWGRFRCPFLRESGDANARTLMTSMNVLLESLRAHCQASRDTDGKPVMERIGFLQTQITEQLNSMAQSRTAPKGHEASQTKISSSIPMTILEAQATQFFLAAGDCAAKSRDQALKERLVSAAVQMADFMAASTPASGVASAGVAVGGNLASIIISRLFGPHSNFDPTNTQNSQMANKYACLYLAAYGHLAKCFPASPKEDPLEYHHPTAPNIGYFFLGGKENAKSAPNPDAMGSVRKLTTVLKAIQDLPEGKSKGVDEKTAELLNHLHAAMMGVMFTPEPEPGTLPPNGQPLTPMTMFDYLNITRMCLEQSTAPRKNLDPKKKAPIRIPPPMKCEMDRRRPGSLILARQSKAHLDRFLVAYARWADAADDIPEDPKNPKERTDEDFQNLTDDLLKTIRDAGASSADKKSEDAANPKAGAKSDKPEKPLEGHASPLELDPILKLVADEPLKAKWDHFANWESQWPDPKVYQQWLRARFGLDPSTSGKEDNDSSHLPGPEDREPILGYREMVPKLQPIFGAQLAQLKKEYDELHGVRTDEGLKAKLPDHGLLSGFKTRVAERRRGRAPKAAPLAPETQARVHSDDVRSIVGHLANACLLASVWVLSPNLLVTENELRDKYTQICKPFHCAKPPSLPIFTERPVELGISNARTEKERELERKLLLDNKKAQALEFHRQQCENLGNYEETLKAFISNYERFGNVCGQHAAATSGE